MTAPLYRPMRARDPREARGQTPLELLFDLAFAAASGAAAIQFADTLRGTGWAEATLAFAMAFFAIWWAWLNFSWLMSAYDTGDGVTWLVTTLQVIGACVLAAGVPGAAAEQDFTVITIGYAVMRLPLAAQWARAAAGDPARRSTCLRYAAGLLVVQAGWLGRLALPGEWLLPVFLLLAAAEFAVPAWAQRAGRMPTNPGHLAGRYGRFTLTVAAQVVAAAIYAIQQAVAEDAARGPLALVAVLAVGLVGCLLWLYHALPHARLAAGPSPRLWEYGHFLIVGAVGAVGAGARFLAEGVVSGGAGAGGIQRWAAHPLALAVAVAVASIWLVCVLPSRQHPAGWVRARYPGCAVSVVLAPVAIPSPLWAAGTVGLLLLALAATEYRAWAGDR
ncbi:low temperature requirement protein A [Amycolatopsis cihanbeyliensis]|uniref:Low temperature requirement protein LtrA n=1 Tax=Amycolatopsis cihanbeyliensis TaxID=1128664 RepID=A0A542DQC2_AMYCI|nr:low temperature requirement protein A [Amycolatopsis cihanbeyliensis]TQJ05303.1 low temperature requirement protein LtrA [Amycolatopsis cihanbeyliensis]